MVPQPNVAESTAHHDVVVTAPRTVGVERAPRHIVRDQMLARRRARRDTASGRDMVRCNRIADLDQHACVLDGRAWLRLDLRVGEVRGQLDICAARIPIEAFRLLRGQRFPLFGPDVHRRVPILKLLRPHRVQDSRRDLILRRPDV